MKNKKDLTTGSIKKLLTEMTIPMIFGMLGFVIFNMTDTFFISRLGVNEMAAMAFTFPVVFVIASFAMGLGQGTSAVISKAVGEGDMKHVKRYTTDSLLLGVFFVGLFSIAGLLTVEPLFKALGATKTTLPFIKDYMYIWYSSVAVLIIPMIGNNAIRGIGDVKTPAMIMMISAGVNIVLDPLFIFGYGPVPAMGVKGAAIATVTARVISLICSLYILYFRQHIITFEINFREMKESVKKISYIGLPVGFSRSLIPAGAGIITRLVASFGEKAVAAFGICSRIEFFALCVIVALATVIGPFVGQNIGAGKKDRVLKGYLTSIKFSVLWGAGIYVLFLFIGKYIAIGFNTDPDVIKYIITYLSIVPIGYGLQGLLIISVTCLNVLNKPLSSSVLSIAQMFLLYIPAAYFMVRFLGFDIKGVFYAIVLSFGVTGIIAYFGVRQQIFNESV